MQIAIHAGAHFTDDDRLIRCLTNNAEMLSHQGVCVPHVGTYRKQLRDMVHDFRRNPSQTNGRQALLDGILGKDEPDRLVLSHPNIISVHSLALFPGGFYHKADARIGDMVNFFARDSIEVFFAIRNPATFIPAIFQNTKNTSFDAFMQGIDPEDLLWSELFMRIRDAAPNVTLTVWCNEDLPLVSDEVLREMAALDPTDKLEGGHDLLKDIMAPDGYKRFEDYVAAHPDMSEIQKRRVVAAFLDKFALEDELEEELEVPGWDHGLVEALTDIYDEDVFQIQRIPGVNLITP